MCQTFVVAYFPLTRELALQLENYIDDIASARPIVDDKRVMRNYPEQPPIIPHSIENYQLTLKTNRCLECHRRQFTEGSGAPMISVTHFMDRNGQILADVTPRRYFCTACHVQQTDARPLVPNTFTDMLATPEPKTKR